MGRRSGSLMRILKPIIAGIALAYFVTAFVDKPASVHFEPDNPKAASQEEIVESQTALVQEKNIMKLGSPLTAEKDEGVSSLAPLFPLEGGTDFNATLGEGEAENAPSVVRVEVMDNATAP